MTRKNLLTILIFGLMLYSCGSFAADNGNTIVQAHTIADIANNIMASFQSVGKLLIASAYLVGIGLLISAIFRFKKNRDNPSSTPLSAPIATFAIGVAFIFLPALIEPAGLTIFGGSKSTLDQTAGGFHGKGATNLPGFTE